MVNTGAFSMHTHLLGQGVLSILSSHFQLQKEHQKKQGTQQEKNRKPARALQENTRNTQDDSKSKAWVEHLFDES